MQIWRTLAAALVIIGCASAGGVFPEAGEPTAAINNARQLVTEAQQAGADSLAAEPLAMARQNLAAAESFLQNRQSERAALKAQEAAADARFALEQARRTLADRDAAQARSAFQALPPQGGGR
jgi:hypothetical protein